MPDAFEDPFEAFRKKKREEDERKREEAEAEARQASEEEAARKIAEEQGAVLDEVDEETGEKKKRPLIFTRMLRKISKKGEVKDTDKPSGFDDHRFSGTKQDGEAEGGDRPEGMQSDRFD